MSTLQLDYFEYTIRIKSVMISCAVICMSKQNNAKRLSEQYKRIRSKQEKH